MPRKKIIKKASKKIKVNKKQSRFLSEFKLKESYISLFLGALVVLIVAVVGLSSLKMNALHKGTVQETSSTHTELSVPDVIGNSQSGQSYVVRPGDDLWHISEKFYKSGYNWIDIAKANNITNPGIIFSGTRLIIPNVEPILSPEEARIQQIGMSQAQGAILENTYTVVKGDDLWNIAVRAYGDGYKYTDIIKANNLQNPSLIFSGNVLKIPR